MRKNRPELPDEAAIPPGHGLEDGQHLGRQPLDLTQFVEHAELDPARFEASLLSFQVLHRASL